MSSWPGGWQILGTPQIQWRGCLPGATGLAERWPMLVSPLYGIHTVPGTAAVQPSCSMHQEQQLSSDLPRAMCRPSYLEGRLRLADKERQRKQSKAAAPAGDPAPPDRQALEALEAQANANMAALLKEEASTKACTPMGQPCI